MADVPPHVCLRVKGWFSCIAQTARPPFTLPGRPEIALDLECFLARFPMRMNAADRASLAAARARFERRRADLAAVQAPDYQPRAVTGLKPGTALRRYQRVAVDLLARRRAQLCGDEVGLGKTVTAIGAMLLDGGLPAVVVTEPHVQRQWAAKIAEFTDLSVHAVRTRTPYKLPAADVTLFRYSNLAGWINVLAEMRVGLACWDEIQALRTGVGTQADPKAKGIASAVLARRATLRLGLSATPIYNYGGEIFNVLSFLDPAVLGSADLFTREWGAVGGRLSDPEALRAYMTENGVFIRRTRADVGRELPPVNKILEEVDPDGSALADIEETARSLAMTAATGSFTERGQATRELDLRVRHATGVAKARSVATYVRILVESGEPVVLVGWHRDVYAIWQGALEDLEPVYYTGSESAAAKAESARAFMAGETDLMIASLRSGAGLDGLQDRCKTIVFGEFDWSPPVHHQWIGRLARDRTDGGPANQVLAVFIWTDDGSDPPMMEVLGLKASEQAAVIDGGAIQEGLSDREGLRALVNRRMSREDADRQLDAPGEVIRPPDGAPAAPPEGAPAFDPSPAPPPPEGPSAGPEPPDWARCPVIPLGHLDGRYFFTDVGGQFRAMRAGALNVAGLSDLFGGQVGWLSSAFPGTGQNKGFFDYRKAAAALIERCWAAGFFNPDGAVRGRGLWPLGKGPGEGGGFVLHLGETVRNVPPEGGYARAAAVPVGGRIGKFVYSARDAWPPPADEPLSADEGAEFADFIERRWNWAKGGLPAAWLYTGWVFIAQAPALLRYRPPLWILADGASGKSTLLKLARALQHERAVYLENLTESSLRERLVRDEARAVLIDEAEAKQEGADRGGTRAARMAELIDSIRYAFDAEQGGWARGGRDGGVGKMEAIFALGAVNMPPVEATDLSRMVKLQLGPLPKSRGAADDAAFKADLARYSAWGPRLFRRALDEWGRMDEAVAAYWALLRGAGHTARGADALAVVFAGYELMIDAGPAPAALRRERIGAIDASAAAIEQEGLGNADLCWNTLVTSRFGDWNNGVQETIGEALSRALDEDSNSDRYRRELRQIGICITDPDGKVAAAETRARDRYIAVSNQHAGLDAIFRRAGRGAWCGGGHINALSGLTFETRLEAPVKRSADKEDRRDASGTATGRVETRRFPPLFMGASRCPVRKRPSRSRARAQAISLFFWEQRNRKRERGRKPAERKARRGVPHPVPKPSRPGTPRSSSAKGEMMGNRMSKKPNLGPYRFEPIEGEAVEGPPGDGWRLLADEPADKPRQRTLAPRTPFARAHRACADLPGEAAKVRADLKARAYGALGERPRADRARDEAGQAALVLIRHPDPGVKPVPAEWRIVKARVSRAGKIMRTQPIGDYTRFVGVIGTLGRLVASARLRASGPPPGARDISLVDEVVDWTLPLPGAERALLLSIAMGARPSDLAEALGLTRSALDWRVKAACGSIVARLKDGRLRSKASKSGA
eukprot:g13667.t1